MAENNKNIKILVVDDEKGMQKLLDYYWANMNVLALKAYTISEAERLFEENTDVSFIAIDGCVPGNRLNTIPLINFFRKSYQGIIIAIAGNDNDRDKMINAGCDYECEKTELPNKVLEILKNKKENKNGQK